MAEQQQRLQSHSPEEQDALSLVLQVVCVFLHGGVMSVVYVPRHSVWFHFGCTYQSVWYHLTITYVSHVHILHANVSSTYTQLSQYDEINDEVRRHRREIQHLAQQCDAHVKRLQEVLCFHGGVAFDGIAFDGVAFDGVAFDGVAFDGVAVWVF